LVEVAVDAAAWCVGVGAGSADSSAPVRDWKPASSLAEVMMMVRRQMAAARVACWMQRARVECSGAALSGGEGVVPGQQRGPAVKQRD
jgi:hypothetical protein